MGSAPYEDIARIARAATEPLAPADRAAAVLEELRSVVPYDHAEIAVLDPFDGQPPRARQRRLPGRHADPLPRAAVRGGDPVAEHARDRLSGADARRSGDCLAVRTIAEMLVPAGYSEGMTMCLRTSSGRETGLLNLSTSDARHPTDTERDVVSALCSTLANVADATQSARFLLSLLEPGAFAIALSRDGAVTPAGRRRDASAPRRRRPSPPPRARHHVAGRPATARASCGPPTIAAGTGSASRRAGRRALAGCDAVVFVQPETIAIDLTRRELEVLTMLTSGWSNAEIGSRLWISPRTVGTYVESVLAKLDVPTRAAAAARAVADGMIVPLEAFTDDAAGKRAP